MKHTDSQERFNSWSTTYEGSFTWRHFFAPLHEMMAERAGDLEGSSVLDIGCGTGDMLRRFYSAGAARLAGADASEGMLEVARASLEGTGAELYASSAESLPFPDAQFDLVTTCIAFHHFPDPGGALAEVSRVLRSGGRFLLCDMCGEGWLSHVMFFYGSRVATDEKYYTRSELSAMLTSAGLEVGAAEIVRRFPPAMLIDASAPTVTAAPLLGNA